MKTRLLSAFLAMSLLLSACSPAAPSSSGTASDSGKPSTSSSSEKSKEDATSSQPKPVAKLEIPVEPEWVIPPEYDKIVSYNDGYTVASKGNILYVIDKAGTITTTLDYTKLPEQYSHGSIISPTDPVEASIYEGGMIGIRMGHVSVFFIDKDGNKVLSLYEPPADKNTANTVAYSNECGVFSDKYTWSGDRPYWNEETLKYIDQTGKIAFMSPPGDVLKVNSFAEGLAMQQVTIDNVSHIRYLDLNGKVALDFPEYHDGGSFRNGYAWVAGAAGEGLIDKTGKVIIEPIYGAIGDVGTDNLMLFKPKDGELRGLMDLTGKVVMEPKFKDNYSLYESISYATEDGVTYGYVNAKGEYVITPRFAHALPSSDGMMVVKDAKTQKYGAIKNPLM